MKILAVILMIVFLILMMRVGATAEYSAEGVLLVVHAGPVSIKLLPKKPSDKKKEKPEKKKKPKSEKPKEDTEGKSKKGGKFSLILKLLPKVGEALGSFKKKLTIDELTINFISASSDPAKAAMAYGYSSAAIGMVLPFFENNFNLKKRNITASVDFTETEPKIYIKAKLMIRIISIIGIALSFAFGALKILKETQEI